MSGKTCARKGPWLLGLSLVMLLWPAVSAAAVDFQVANISNNAFNNYYPDINDRGQAVWSGGGEIYYFDTRWDPGTHSPVNLSNSSAALL